MSYGSDSTQANPGQQGGNKNQQATNSTVPLGDGGFAFRVSDYAMASGMSLRDYFAAKALASLIEATEKQENESVRQYRRWCARTAYKYADAMLAARKAVGE